MAKFTVAEGVGNIIMDNNHPLHGAAYDLGEWNEKHQDQFAGAIEAYHALWDSLNAKRGYPWKNNDWVKVIEFERTDKP